MRSRSRLSHLAAVALLVLSCAVLRAGELKKVTVASPSLGGEDMPVNVLLPDGYGESDRRYPAVYLLHGYGGDYAEWARIGIQERAAGVEAILVMPEGDKSFWVNHHESDRNRWDDWVTKDLIAFVDREYHTIARRDGRAISGLSMGGYGALALGLRHADLFGAVASHSGALAVPGAVGGGDIAARITEIFGPEGSPTRSTYSLVRLIESLPAERRPDLYIDCGSQDFLLASNREYVAKLAELQVPYEYREVPGRHDFAYWNRNVRYSLRHQLRALANLRESPPPAPKELAAATVAGLWNAVSELPDGTDGRSTLTLEQEGTKVHGRAEWDSGGIDLDKGSFVDERLTLEAEFERDGEELKVVVKAKLVERKKLSGTWAVLNRSDTEVFSGAWSAEAEKLTEVKPAPKAAANAAVVGEWALAVNYGTGDLEYTLQIAEKDGALAATVVSPRSGPHPCRSAKFADGVLTLELERSYEGQAVVLTYTGKVRDGRIEGTISSPGLDQPFEWKAEKKAPEKKVTDI